MNPQDCAKAAAPELLAALRTIRDSTAHAESLGYERAMTEWLTYLHEIARDAIAKAGG